MQSKAPAAGRRHGRAVTVVVLGLALTVMGAFITSGSSQAQTERATQAFRDLHTSLRKHINHMTAQVGQLPKQDAATQKATMLHVVDCFAENIHEHGKIEEDALYPVVDRVAGTPEPNNITASLRYEHRIMGRWLTELRNQANQATPDATAFARRADNLLGLLTAHFEEEEDILLPILDAKMTAAQFKKEVMDKMEG